MPSLYVLRPEKARGEREHTARSLIQNVKTTDQSNRTCEAHNGRETAAANARWAHLLHNPERKRGSGSRSTGQGVVGVPSISKHTSHMAIDFGELLILGSRGLGRGVGAGGSVKHTGRCQ